MWGMGVLLSAPYPHSLLLLPLPTCALPHRSLSRPRLATLLDSPVCVCVRQGVGILGSLTRHNAMKTRAWVPFLQILVPALSVCFIFTVTIGMFPAVTAEVQSSIAGNSAWGEDTMDSQDGDRRG